MATATRATASGVANQSIHLTQPLLGRRHDARLRVELRARLITLEGTASAVLADLARFGARIYAPDCGLRTGREAVLAWDRFEAFGDVVWTDGAYLGLQFEQPLSKAVLMATRAAEDARPMPLYRQLQREAAQAFVDPRYKP